MKKAICLSLIFLSFQAQAANPFFDFVIHKQGEKIVMAPTLPPKPTPSPAIKPLSLGCLASTLVNSEATILYKFDYDFQCQEALNSQKNELLCLNASLKNLEGMLVHQFNYNFECERALASIRGPIFCAGSTALSTTGSVIYKFDYDFQCQESLELFFNKTK